MTLERTIEDPRIALFAVLFLACLTPWASPALALAAGAMAALTVGNPLPGASASAAKWMLQASVVGLGFGMSLGAVARAGGAGVLYTIGGIATAMTLGTLLGRWLRVEGKTSFLITAGTSICGGSAIAAVGPAIGAEGESMSMALAVVFVLNAVALYLFPAIGHLLGLTQGQFAVWAAIAIHDTSSVVGAAASYGPRALQSATVLKLARALWIVPLALGAAAWTRRRTEGEVARVKLPWFILFFVLAAALRSLAPAGLMPALDALTSAARAGLVATLFLIGAGLTRGTLRQVGLRPMLQGVGLWVAVAGLTLTAVLLGASA
ncbi:MAG TPA: putative sulfate exporter family transporter [Longimicrobiaceae bacterium]|nr:putative sulfate exporter family transporter [Longimicrobiaceae bacterium]